MGETGQATVLFLFVLLVYIGVPVTIVAGWLRWLRRPQKPATFSALASLAALSLSTVSALVAISYFVYQVAKVSSNPSLVPYRWGARFSVAALLCAVGGLWRRQPLRWNALVCSAG